MSISREEMAALQSALKLLKELLTEANLKTKNFMDHRVLVLALTQINDSSEVFYRDFSQYTLNDLSPFPLLMAPNRRFFPDNYVGAQLISNPTIAPRFFDCLSQLADVGLSRETLMFFLSCGVSLNRLNSDAEPAFCQRLFTQLNTHHRPFCQEIFDIHHGFTASELQQRTTPDQLLLLRRLFAALRITQPTPALTNNSAAIAPEIVTQQSSPMSIVDSPSPAALATQPVSLNHDKPSHQVRKVMGSSASVWPRNQPLPQKKISKIAVVEPEGRWPRGLSLHPGSSCAQVGSNFASFGKKSTTTTMAVVRHKRPKND